MGAFRELGNRGNNGGHVYRIRCEWCWEIFHARQVQARTCSVAHRLRLSRWCRAYRELTGITPNTGPRGDLKRKLARSAALLDGHTPADRKDRRGK